ncbi:MAG: hypothetical protein ABFR90_11110 [Planctomycetota bacterium]
MKGMESMMYFSLVTASISFTVTEDKLFKPVRERSHVWNSISGELFSRGYCLVKWFSMGPYVLGDDTAGK